MSSRRLVPPTNLLIAFCATAKHLSVSRAADELNLTQSAVSRQVQQLEELLGVRMFDRVKKRLVLTEVGQAYAEAIRPALDTIADATLTSAIRSDGNILNIASLPTFGSRWLIPRMPAFHEKHPDIAIHFNTRLEVFDFSAVQIDAAIHFGDEWPGASLDFLMNEIQVPVCSPSYAEEHNIREEADLAGCTLLQVISRRNSWEEWFEQGGLSKRDMKLGPSYQLYSMLAQAAVSGLGVALIPDFLMETELAAGRLIAPFGRTLRSKSSYYLAYPPRSRALRSFQAFRGWLLEEVRTLNP